MMFLGVVKSANSVTGLEGDLGNAAKDGTQIILRKERRMVR